MPVTIADVAKLAGVSKATVSAVLNDRPGISHDTRIHVQDIVKKLNFRPNRLARSLSIRSTKSIGLVIKEIDNPFFAKVMKGVFDTCCKYEYTVLLGSSELSPSQEIRSIETLTSQRVDGLIISPLQGKDVDFTYLLDLIKENYPFVMLGTIKNYLTNVVEINNVEAAYTAVSYLIKLGHREIAYFAGPAYSAHSEDRLEGYKNALIDNRIPIPKAHIVATGSYIKNGYNAGKKMFSQKKDRPSAVLCYNDLVAIGLINALLELGIEIPHEVSVIGFDDIDFCSSVKIPLTTIHIPAHEIGEKATELLFRQIHNRYQPLNEKIIVEAQLIERSSCTRYILP